MAPRNHGLREIKLLVEFKRAGLNRQCPRRGSWLGGLLENAYPDAKPGQPKRQHQAGRARANNQDVSLRHLLHSASIIAPATTARNSRGNAMRNRAWSRRDVLKTSTALAAGALFAEPARAAAPPPTSVTPALVEAARKEGKLSYYCALELNVGERLARLFEAKYPGIAVRVERSGAERIFQRIAQEQASGINAV